MDYEKMYKAVLKTAKQWIEDGCSDKEKICLESIFPELRESEDERIRKEIIDFIQWAEDRGMTRHDYHQAKRPAVWIAYLEKQKECVADSSKTSVDEDESIRKFLVDYFTSYKIGNVATKLNGVRIDDILNYLEKQKETLHILEMCKENANSFTDGVIEVRSFQRGLEEGKRLERQKENSKSADSISSDCESNAKCENRWHKVEDSLPDSTREVLCKDAIGNYFIGRYYSKGVWEVSMYDDCDKSNEDNPPVVKWCEIPSEKQKEQKPRWEINNPHTTKWTKEMIDEKFEELVEEYHKQQPVQSEEEKEYVRTLKGLVSDFIRDSGGGITDVEYYQNICDWLDGRHIEQKPAEWDDYTKTNLGRAIQIIKDARGTLHGYQTDDGIYECDKAIEALEHFLYRGLEIEKSAEWSEEDERNKDRAIFYTCYYQRTNGTTDGSKECIDWLKSLRPSWKPSEAQLMALHSVIDDESDTIGNEQLKLLYNDLKKLGIEEEPEYYQHFDPDC